MPICYTLIFINADQLLKFKIHHFLDGTISVPNGSPDIEDLLAKQGITKALEEVTLGDLTTFDDLLPLCHFPNSDEPLSNHPDLSELVFELIYSMDWIPNAGVIYVECGDEGLDSTFWERFPQEFYNLAVPQVNRMRNRPRPEMPRLLTFQKLRDELKEAIHHEFEIGMSADEVRRQTLERELAWAKQQMEDRGPYVTPYESPLDDITEMAGEFIPEFVRLCEQELRSLQIKQQKEGDDHMEYFLPIWQNNVAEIISAIKNGFDDYLIIISG
jgi:hypothetical protein